MKKTIWAVLFILIVGLIVIKYDKSVSDGVKPVSPAADFKNGTAYLIDNQVVTLENGRAEVAAAPGSASKTVTQYFGNDVEGDFNNDGQKDAAFIVTQNSGGSGTFYYVVVALKTGDGYVGTNAVLLGDRIAPQTTEFKNGQIIVNYADRKPGEPMAATPSVGISKYLEVVVSSDAVSLDEVPAK